MAANRSGIKVQGGRYRERRPGHLYVRASDNNSNDNKDTTTTTTTTTTITTTDDDDDDNAAGTRLCADKDAGGYTDFWEEKEMNDNSNLASWSGNGISEFAELNQPILFNNPLAKLQCHMKYMLVTPYIVPPFSRFEVHVSVQPAMYKIITLIYNVIA